MDSAGKTLEAPRYHNPTKEIVTASAAQHPTDASQASAKWIPYPTPPTDCVLGRIPSPLALNLRTPSPCDSSFTRLVDEIKRTLGPDKGLHGAGENGIAERLVEIMSNYKSNEEEWKQYAHWDPKAQRYTRNLVDDGNGQFNLLVLCWPAGVKSAIHDHPNAHCIMKILQGSMTEARFEWPSDADASARQDDKIASQTLCAGSTTSLDADANMEQKAVRVLERDGVAYMHDKFGVHQMSNSSKTERAVSLHLYSPPIPACKIFDAASGAHRQVDCSRIDSKCGDRLPL